MDEEVYYENIRFDIEKIISFYETMAHHIINRDSVGDLLRSYRLAKLNEFEMRLCDILIDEYESEYAGKLEDTIVYMKDNISFREYVKIRLRDPMFDVCPDYDIRDFMSDEEYYVTGLS